MKIEQVIKELEQAVRQLGIETRWEKGSFRGGRCTVNGRDFLVLNKQQPPEVHLVVLSESLRALPVDTIFMKPAVRQAMEDAWDRQVSADDLAEGLAEERADDA